MTYYSILVLIVLAGIVAAVGLVLVSRADHRETSLPAKDNATSASGSRQDELNRLRVDLYDVSLMLALVGLRKQGEEVPRDALLHRLAPKLAGWKDLQGVADVPTSMTIDPRTIRQVMKAPVEDLSLSVLTYNHVKRLGLHDLASVLATSTAALASFQDAPALRRLDELQSAIASYLAEQASPMQLTGVIDAATLQPDPVTGRSNVQVYRDREGQYRIRITGQAMGNVEISGSFETEEEARRLLGEVRAIFAEA